jgi:hypothetical protein
MTRNLGECARAAAFIAVLAALSPRGGSDSNLGPANGPPAYASVPLPKVSQPTTLAPNCDRVTG